MSDDAQDRTAPDPIGPRPAAAPDVDFSAITDSLKRTKPWVRFLSILGFITVGFMMLIGLGMGAVGVAMQDPMMIGMVVLYPLMGLLYIFPSLYLYRYADRIGEFVAGGGKAQLEAAIEAQRSFWKFAGVLVLVSMVISVVFMALAIGLGVIAGMTGMAAR